MSSVTVKPVTTRREQKQFLKLPWTIYRDDANWIPPLRLNQEELLSYRPHPFYDDAEVQTFLALRDGQVCGRVAAIVNHAHNRRYKERRGFFGFFESVDDQQVASGLLDAAAAWLAERDIRAIRGPTNPSLNYECGLLIEAADGFDGSPTFMMTYNPLYYARLIEGYGFRKVQDLYAYWGHVDMLDTLDKKVHRIVVEVQRRFNVKLRPFDRKRFSEEVRTFLDIYNRSLGGTWGFVPLSNKESEHMGAGMRHLIVPEMTSMAEVDGKVIGSVFGMLDYNPRIRKINGRLLPFGFLRLLWNRRRIKRVRLISTNVVPEYQQWGVGPLLLHRLVPGVLDWGIQEVEFSWVLESNFLSWGTLQRGGAIRTRTYRIYDYEPDAD